MPLGKAKMNPRFLLMIIRIWIVELSSGLPPSDTYTSCDPLAYIICDNEVVLPKTNDILLLGVYYDINRSLLEELASCLWYNRAKYKNNNVAVFILIIGSCNRNIS